MHPLTRFFDYLKRIEFSLALAREHIDDRELTEWYTDWMYELGSSEGMVPFIADARTRLLTPDALHIPRRCTTYLVPAEDPELTRAEWALSYEM